MSPTQYNPKYNGVAKDGSDKNEREAKGPHYLIHGPIFILSLSKTKGT